MDINIIEIDRILEKALNEDIGTGDITTNSIVPKDATTIAYIYAKKPGVIAGLPVAERTFKKLDPNLSFRYKVQDGAMVEKGTVLAEVNGSARAILTAERVALNLLQRLSGIATKTNNIAKSIADTGAKIVDTRKTTPGLRMLEKYAVRVGGGTNHRFGLYDAVLIKDNHIKVASGIKNAVLSARKMAPHTMKIEVECEYIEQVQEALEVGADIIMLDNMANENIKQAVQIINKKALIEVSGGINEDTIREAAVAGVDLISVGALTHSVVALDISLDIREIKIKNL